MVETDAPSFRDIFLQVLAASLPSWQGYIADSAMTQGPVLVCPPNWNGLPFRIEIGSDSLSVFPLCRFGIDYISTATAEDLKERPKLVFAKPVSEISDFVNGRTVVSVKRHQWLFVRLGWDVRFVPRSALDHARRSGAQIIAWPT
jgi:hypothetical protein